MKKILSVFLCGIMLLCLAACGKNTNSNIQSSESTNQSEFNNTDNSITNTQPSESTNQSKSNSTHNSITNTQPNESTNQSDTNNQETAIFNTKNIKRITFYAYYGSGKGSDVPVEHLDEFITWLDSFSIDKETPEILPPGTNTIKVEIDYFDGTIVKKGLDTTTVDGITYYIKGDTAPECYEEIISKTSLN